MTGPVIIPPGKGQKPEITGRSFEIYEWTGSGPEYLHVHHSDDEAWIILEGTLTFRFQEGEVDAPPGTTVFVPAGVAHSYYEAHGPTRYLIIMTPRLRRLIDELHQVPFVQHRDVLKRYQSELVE